MTLQQFQHAACCMLHAAACELRRRRQRRWRRRRRRRLLAKWQCNMIALGLATCHIYHSSKRWKISHSFILHPNAESCLTPLPSLSQCTSLSLLQSNRKPVCGSCKSFLHYFATTCRSLLLCLLLSPSLSSPPLSRTLCSSAACNNMQMTLLIFMNFSDYENCFWAFGVPQGGRRQEAWGRQLAWQAHDASRIFISRRCCSVTHKLHVARCTLQSTVPARV